MSVDIVVGHPDLVKTLTALTEKGFRHVMSSVYEEKENYPGELEPQLAAQLAGDGFAIYSESMSELKVTRRKHRGDDGQWVFTHYMCDTY